MIVPMNKKENIEKEWFVFFEFIIEILNLYHLIFCEEAMGNNIVDDIR